MPSGSSAHSSLSLNGAESLLRALLRLASLRAERKALWYNSDTVPAAGIDDESIYNDTRRTLVQKISRRGGLYEEET